MESITRLLLLAAIINCGGSIAEELELVAATPCRIPPTPKNAYSFCRDLHNSLVCVALCPTYFLNDPNATNAVVLLRCNLSNGVWTTPSSFPRCAPSSKPSTSRTSRTSRTLSSKPLSTKMHTTKFTSRSRLFTSPTIEPTHSHVRSESVSLQSTIVSSSSSSPSSSSKKIETTHSKLQSSSVSPTAIKSSTTSIKQSSASSETSLPSTILSASSSKKVKSTHSIHTESVSTTQSNSSSKRSTFRSSTALNASSFGSTCFPGGLFTSTQVGSTQTTTFSSAHVTRSVHPGTTSSLLPTTSGCNCYCL